MQRNLFFFLHRQGGKYRSFYSWDFIVTVTQDAFIADKLFPVIASSFSHHTQMHTYTVWAHSPIVMIMDSVLLDLGSGGQHKLLNGLWNNPNCINLLDLTSLSHTHTLMYMHSHSYKCIHENTHQHTLLPHIETHRSSDAIGLVFNWWGDRTLRMERRPFNQMEWWSKGWSGGRTEVLVGRKTNE